MIDRVGEITRPKRNTIILNLTAVLNNNGLKEKFNTSTITIKNMPESQLSIENPGKISAIRNKKKTSTRTKKITIRGLITYFWTNLFT